MPNRRLKEPIMLAPEVAKDLRDMGPDITMLEREINKAKRAGIPIEDLETKFDEMKKIRIGLLREYS